MRLAVLPRYINLNKDNNLFNHKRYVNCDYELMANKFGVGLCAVMSPYDIDDLCFFMMVL